MPTVQPKMTDNSSVNALTGLFPMLMVFDSKVDEGKEFVCKICVGKVFNILHVDSLYVFCCVSYRSCTVARRVLADQLH
jgi:hypothetical protein